MLELKFDYSKENTHVENSYLVTDINLEVMSVIRERQFLKLPVTRNFDSYAREWKGHNNLYNLGLFRSHTKDVDLEERLTEEDKIKGLFLDLIWMIIGGV